MNQSSNFIFIDPKGFDDSKIPFSPEIIDKQLLFLKPYVVALEKRKSVYEMEAKYSKEELDIILSKPKH